MCRSLVVFFWSVFLGTNFHQFVIAIRKARSYEYRGFFNGPENVYQRRQPMNNILDNKWSYSSNNQPRMSYGWYWTSNEEAWSNSFQNNIGNSIFDSSCGRVAIQNRFSKIMGGQDAVPYSYPWMVSLGKRSYNNLHMCGGSLITQRHVLTAAHCIEDFDGVGDLNIVAGLHDINDKRQIFRAISIHVHPQYDPETFANDLAVITLAMPIPWNDPRIGTICLPPDDVPGKNYPPPKASAIAIGWGSTYFGGNPSQTLKQVVLPMLETTRWPCNIYITYDQGQLCAGQLNGGVDTCQADSGGPLMLETSNSRWEIIGITSFGKSCGKPNSPGIYTRVATYNSFIRSIIGLTKVGSPIPSSAKKSDSLYSIVFLTIFVIMTLIKKVLLSVK